jgi:hypothetical protein
MNDDASTSHVPNKSTHPSRLSDAFHIPGKEKDTTPAPPPLFVPEPGQKLTREQHALLRAQRAKQAEEEKKQLFGSWSGAVPLTVLLEQCRKNEWDKPQVNIVSIELKLPQHLFF